MIRNGTKQRWAWVVTVGGISSLLLLYFTTSSLCLHLFSVVTCSRRARIFTPRTPDANLKQIGSRNTGGFP